MWVASLVGGAEILAQAATLEDLFTELNELDIAEDVEIAVMWTGDELPPELVEMFGEEE